MANETEKKMDLRFFDAEAQWNAAPIVESWDDDLANDDDVYILIPSRVTHVREPIITLALGPLLVALALSLYALFTAVARWIAV